MHIIDQNSSIKGSFPLQYILLLNSSTTLQLTKLALYTILAAILLLYTFL